MPRTNIGGQETRECSLGKPLPKKIEKLKGKLRQAGSCSPPKACSDLIAALNVTSN